MDEGPTIRTLYNTDDKGKRPVATRSASSSTTSSGRRSVNPAPFEYLDTGFFPERCASPVLRNRGKCQDLERSILVSILSPTANQSQLLSLFIATIRSENPKRTVATYSCHSVWLVQLASRTEVSSTLLHAIRAISLSFFGRRAGDKNLVQNSRLIYGKALLKLNKSLQDPIEGLASDTLSATVLLTFYEMLTCTERDSWIRHAGGVARLMQLRGPNRHRTGVDREIFLASRFSLVVQSYQTGKPCFLSSTSWRELSREIHNSSPKQSAFDDAREDYFQEILHHPEYVMGSVRYMASGGRNRSVLQDLVRRGHMHRSNHKAIYDRFIDAWREAGQEPVEVPSSVDDKVFPIVYRFPGILNASYFCCYWSLLKVLNITLIGLEAKLSTIETTGQRFQEQITPAQRLAARNVQLSRENLTDVIVAESTAPEEFKSAAPASESTFIGSGSDRKTLQDRTLSRASESAISAAGSPTDYPTMSPRDTAKRREMYMAENKHCAQQVCKSVEDVSTSAFLGPIFLIFSMMTIGRMLDDAKEKQWLVHKMRELGRTWGLAADAATEPRMDPRLWGGAVAGCTVELRQSRPVGRPWE